VVSEETRVEPAALQQGGLAAVGVELAAERKRQQLQLESVASDLHLRPEVVRAIETGDEAHLPSQAFVRGYVKSYARLLGLDETALLGHLPQPGADSPAPLKRVGIRQRRRVPLAGGRYLIWGLLVLSLALVTVYAVPALQRIWTARTTEPVSDELVIPLPGYADEVDQSDDAAQQQGPDDDASLSRALPGDDVTAQEQSVAAHAELLPEPQQESQSEVQQVPEAQVGPAVVQLKFLEDSWVEMEAHGRKLVVGTQRAGSERTVRAEPPVHLLLGNAPGVEVVFRGKPVKLKSHQRGKVARITLDD
jgi:cytoskeleton protein RodZ